MPSLFSITRQLALALTLCACKPQRPASVPVAPLPASIAAPAPQERRLWRYEIEAGVGARELAVEALFPIGTPEELSVSSGAERFVRDVEVADGPSWRPLERSRSEGGPWRAGACPDRGCRLRYRFLLADAARGVDDVDQAMASGEVYLATPDSWLLRPTEEVEDTRARLHVTVPAGLRFVSGLFPAPDGAPDTYEADTANLDAAPYSGFGPLHTYRNETMGGRLELAIVPGAFRRSDGELVEWATRSARTVAAYYAGFPVPRLLLIVVPAWRGGIEFGTTMGNGGAAIVVFVGRRADPEDLTDDWVLPHEMIHLAMSHLPRRHRWLKEGIATYVEPIARARQGKVSAEEVWGRFLASMEEGLPGWRDRGLDNTPTWGRIYWGGALFCLVADIEIRERTGNRKSIDDAFRAIVRAGASIVNERSIESILAEGDRGTGVPVLAGLYAAWANQPVPVDLKALWRRLGVSQQDDAVRFDDQAPLARIRRSITSGTP